MSTATNTVEAVDTMVGGEIIAGIDHVVIGVKDLDAARGDFARLGFTVNPGGRHVGWGTANHTIMFEHDYLNLLSVVDPSQDLNTLDQFLDEGEGIFRTVFATRESDRLCKLLKQETGEDPKTTDLSRVIQLNGDGETVAKFKIVHLPQEWTPGMRTYACGHLTPKLLRRSEWLSHANGARAIAQVTVAMDDLTGVLEPYCRLFGADAVIGDPKKGSVIVETGGARLQLLTPKVFTKEHYDVVLDKSLPLPRLVALTVEVGDPKATALYLSGQQVEFVQEPDGTVQVPPEQAHGVLMEFARAD